MKKVIAVIAAVCILLSGCGVIAENKENGRYVPTSLLDTSKLEYPGSMENLAIYFYNASSKTLTAEIRPITIGQDMNPAEVAVRGLLSGPLNDKLTSLAPGGMTLDNIEYSRDVANVYLKYDGEPLDPRQKYFLEHAISNTVSDILGTDYTCIFYNGIQTGFAGKPYNPIEKKTGNIEDAYSQALSKYEKILSVPTGITPPENKPTATAKPVEQGVIPAQPVETDMPTVLYFISKNGGYILPEVRTVKYTDGKYIQTVISELVRGPLNSSTMEPPLAGDLLLVCEPALVPAENGYILTLNFSKAPARYDTSDTEESMLSYAALTYTLTNLIPGLNSINILVNGNKVNIKENSTDTEAVKRSDYSGLMGSSVPLYFADKNSDLLLQVSRSMEQGRTWSAKQRLLELMKGPLSGDEESAWPVMPSGVNGKDIIAVNVYADTVYVNLTEEFKEACKGFSSKNEMLLVYAIVNTLTAMDGINKVQFLVEGKQTDTLAGFLCLSDPFLRNYGIIKQTS